MATPYLNLDNTATEKFSLARMNSNTDKIEKALYTRRMDLPDRVQLGSDWFTVASTNSEWEVFTDDSSGNKVIRHGPWAMVEFQFRAKKTWNIGATGNINNTHLCTLEKGYYPTERIALTSINSSLGAVVEINTNGNCYITAYNHTSTTINKGELLRVGGRYRYAT